MISLEQVAAAERDGLVPGSVVTCQGQDFGKPEVESHGPDERLALAGCKPRPVRPGIKLEIVGVDDDGRLVPQHDQGPRHGRDMHWLPKAVQHECRSLQHTASHEMRPLCSLPGASDPVPWHNSARTPTLAILPRAKQRCQSRGQVLGSFVGSCEALAQMLDARAAANCSSDLHTFSLNTTSERHPSNVSPTASFRSRR